MFRIELLDNENLEVFARPHPIAFLDLYLIWLFYITAGVVLLVFRDYIGQSLAGAYFLEPILQHISLLKLATIVNIVILFFVFLIPSVFFAFYKINFHWILVTFFFSALMLILAIFTNLEPHIIYTIPVAISLFCILQIEFYRRSHYFFITDRRLVFVRNYFFMAKYVVESYYHHITNLVLKQTFAERCFRCATIIPIMTSGMNLGSEVMELRAGLLFFGFAAQREKKLPRAIPFLCFYSVKRAEQLMSMITPKIVNPMYRM
jgi:hypothetical protein